MFGRNYKIRRLHGSNQYATKYIRYGRYAHTETRSNKNMYLWLTIYGIIVASAFLVKIGAENLLSNTAIAQEESSQVIVSPIPEDGISMKNDPIEKVKAAPKAETPKPQAEDYDIWVGEAVNMFYGNSRERKSEVRMIMHCLLNRESHHSTTIAHGDNGMAGGPLQFWEETWTRMRTRMINDGYAEDLSDRYNMKDAIYTTVYAISKGWGREWGPILRDSTGADWSTCPTPSWY